ncbi:hypothetical protein HGP05_09320 [Streptococcus sanguinis]|uniref:Uncharacterized protein n=1 Tax=Streptococcus sanguinis TaxID=1305 RepID=A0A7Y0YS06_STRSA|nr:hypothetical protein [Streptococcus sanguinis]
MLKDDKSYPLSRLQRNLSAPDYHAKSKKTAALFRTYPDVGAANEIKRLLDRLFFS